MAHKYVYLALSLETIKITVKEFLKSSPTIITESSPKKIYTNGQQAHEKMLIVTSH